MAKQRNLISVCNPAKGFQIQLFKTYLFTDLAALGLRCGIRDFHCSFSGVVAWGLQSLGLSSVSTWAL